jgi:8-oxo-dGTP diphosphatase
MKGNDVDFPQPAVGAVVIHEDKILLVLRADPPQKGKWAVPGGSVKKGETYQEAAKREVLEETGVVISAGDRVHTFEIMERYPDGKIRFHYRVVDVMGDYISGSIKAGDDAADAGWFSREDLEDIEITDTMQILLRKISFI